MWSGASAGLTRNCITRPVVAASAGTSAHTRQYLDLKYQHALGADSEIMARAFLDYYRYHGDYPFDYPPLTLNHDAADGRSWVIFIG